MSSDAVSAKWSSCSSCKCRPVCGCAAAAGVDEAASDVFAERTRLYDSLVEYFPDSMTQPRANLTDMVAFHWWCGNGWRDGRPLLDLPTPEGWKAELTLVLVVSREGLPVGYSTTQAHKMPDCHSDIIIIIRTCSWRWTVALSTLRCHHPLSRPPVWLWERDTAS